MFQIKICGIKDLLTAEACCVAGAEAIGLNFYQKSKRLVSDAVAREISQGMDGRLARVGLFVNHTAQDIVAKTKSINLDWIQLHGHEKVEIANELADLGVDLPILRAVGISKASGKESLQEIEEWSSLEGNSRVEAILLDAKADGLYGGTGKQIDWTWLSSVELPTEKPIILAGGLNASNVSLAIETVRPHGVDVAGGVENSQGIKQPELIQQFVDNAKHSIDRN